MSGNGNCNNRRILKATIIDPLDEESRGVLHYHGELEETIEKIAEKYDLPIRRKARELDEILEHGI